MADKRKILKKGETVRLIAEDGKTVLTFTVTKKLSADNNKIVYTGTAGKRERAWRERGRNPARNESL